MKDKDIFNKIKEVLIEDFEVEEELITLQASFYENLGLDSLDAIDLIVNLNNTYDVDIDNKEIEDIRTIEQLIAIIKKNIDK